MRSLETNHPVIPAILQTAHFLANKRLLDSRQVQLAQDPTVYERMWHQATDPVVGGYHKAKREADKLQLAQYLSSFLNSR